MRFHLCSHRPTARLRRAAILAIFPLAALFTGACDSQSEPEHVSDPALRARAAHAGDPDAATLAATPAIAGSVTQVNAGHGNLYTTILSKNYVDLGLLAGKKIRVVFVPTPTADPAPAAPVPAAPSAPAGPTPAPAAPAATPRTIEVSMTVEKSYYDVPAGQPVAVLHRDTLTFAVRDGNFAQQYNIAKDTPFHLHFASPAE